MCFTSLPLLCQTPNHFLYFYPNRTPLFLLFKSPIMCLIYFSWYLDYIGSDIIIIKSPVIKVLQSIARTFLLKITLALFWYKPQQLIQKSKMIIITTPNFMNLKSWLLPPVVREREKPGDCGKAMILCPFWYWNSGMFPDPALAELCNFPQASWSLPSSRRHQEAWLFNEV